MHIVYGQGGDLVIEDHDTTKEPQQKVIRINTILADSKEYGLTSRENKRKIEQAILDYQVISDCLSIEDDLVISFQKKN